MPKVKEVVVENTNEEKLEMNPNHPGWTDYVLSMLEDDEKIKGNPTTDGLRRIFEKVMNCTVTSSFSHIEGCASRENEGRATVSHQISYTLNDPNVPLASKQRVVNGVADAYWANCDKIYRNFPTAVAESRAEGRALRRALKLRKVVAEEISEDVEVNLDGSTGDFINHNQINCLEKLGKRMNVNLVKLKNSLDISESDTYKIKYDDALKLVQKVTEFQQQNQVPEDLIGYDPDWR